MSAWRGRLAGDPVAAALVAHAYGPSWIADFLTVPPAAPDLTLDQELEHLEPLEDAQIRADLAVVRQPLPPEASATGLAATVADLLRWVWSTAIHPEWPRRKQVLRADVVARTARLSTEGWSGVLRDLAPGVRRLGGRHAPGQHQPVPASRHPRRRPAVLRRTQPRRRCAVASTGPLCPRLPVSGSSTAQSADVPHALARLLGRSRARVLCTAQAPVSTSALTALTGLPLGSVGGYLRVLLEAGLLERRRAGRHRSVLVH